MYREGTPAHRASAPPHSLTFSDSGGWPRVLGPLTSGQDLTSEQAAAAMTEILAGNASQAQIAGFIIALRMKGETIDEMAGLLSAMQDASEHVPLADLDGVIDTCGTGGDRSHSINVSTIAAFVVAGAGGKVGKHGNRAASSACGSAGAVEAMARCGATSSTLRRTASRELTPRPCGAATRSPTLPRRERFSRVMRDPTATSSCSMLPPD